MAYARAMPDVRARTRCFVSYVMLIKLECSM